jgi:glycosyltransferase involved in cell wall biosynthesis
MTATTVASPVRCSVVIPVYNRSDLLRAVLQGLVAQTINRTAFEVLVCNDGSSEPLDAVVEGFRAALPGLQHLHQRNQGPAAARNLGIEHATAPIVLFLDSDVLPEPNVVRALTEALEKHSDWQGAEARLVPIGGSGTVVWEAPGSDSGGHYHTAGIAYRKSVLEAVGGLDEGFSMAACEDVELAFHVLRHGPIGFVPGAVVLHPRRRRTVASTWKARRNWRFVQIMACRHGFVAWPQHRTRWPRLETALCAAVKVPIGRTMSALKSIGKSPADGLAGLGLAVVGTVAGWSMVPTILFAPAPARRSRFLHAPEQVK